jgi:hypothetical protein
MPTITGPQLRSMPARAALDRLLWEEVFECRPEPRPYSRDITATMELISGMEALG